jgi:hypothetical protein
MALSFEPLPYWWLAVGAGVVAAAAAVAALWRARRAVGARQAALFLLLRLGAIAALLLFVSGPGRTVVYTASAAAPVAILVDSSASMDLPAGEGTRLGASLAAARAVARAVKENGGRCEVHDFAARRRPWGDVIPEEQRLREGARGRTDAAGALRELAARYGKEGLTAAVVLSDGVWDAAPAAEGLPPCFTAPPSDRPPANSLFISDVEAPAAVLPGTAFDVRVRYYSTLEEGEAASATVAEEGGGETVCDFKPRAGAGEAVVRATVREAGDRFFRVATTPGWGESWFDVKVLADPLAVWYWEMAGDADFAFLKRALATHAGLALTYRLDAGGTVVGWSAAPPEGTDVIVLGNPRAAKMTAADAEVLERHVARGGGLLVVASARPVDAAVLSTGPLARLLPVRVRPDVTEAGGGPLSAPSYPGGPRVAAAPPTVTHVWRLGPLKESATPVWEAADGTPALAIMPYGLGRVALLAAGGLYKWRLAAGGDVGALAAALVLALYNEQTGLLAVSRHVAEPGAAVEVTCRTPLEPTVAYADPAGVVGRVAMSQVGEELWTGDLDVEAEGKYELTARASFAGNAEVARTAVLVKPPTSESRGFFPRPDAMIALAEATGGRYFDAGGAKELARAVAARVSAAPRVAATARRDLWPAWLAFPAALAFLVADWVLRRRSGLP